MNNNNNNCESEILTLLLAIKGICLSRQIYFLGDFNILVQIMPVATAPYPYKGPFNL